jgi:hypothetical protein
VNKKLIEFWQGSAEYDIYSILYDWSDIAWELKHDFIQWVFPTKTRCEHNKDAPILDDKTVLALKVEDEFDELFRLAVDRFIKFLQNNEALKIENHNWLRISRAIDSCNILGYPDLAKKIFDFAYENIPDKDHPSVTIWQNLLENR